jgi:hypothetical protein
LLYWDEWFGTEYTFIGSWPEISGDMDSCLFFGNVYPCPQIEFIDIQPESLSFSMSIGDSLPNGKQLTITNRSGCELNWTADVDVDWLSLSSQSGTAPSTIVVTPTSNELSVGQHQATVSFKAQNAESVQISVSLVVKSSNEFSDGGRQDDVVQSEDGGDDNQEGNGCGCNILSDRLLNSVLFFYCLLFIVFLVYRNLRRSFSRQDMNL